VDATAFAELFHACFGKAVDADYCRWKFDRNPAGKAIHVIAGSRHRLVGAVNFIPSRFLIDGSEILACQSVDTMVHPEFRRQGLFTRMSELALACMSERGWEFKYNFPGEASLPGYLKLGHERLFDFDYWVAVNWKQLIKRVVNRALRISAQGVQNTSAHPEFGETFERLWERTRPSQGITQVRDARYLQWRYGERPDKAYKLLIAEEKSGALKGFAVTAGANIVDIWTDNRRTSIEGLLANALASINDSGESIAHVWTSPRLLDNSILVALGLRRQQGARLLPSRLFYPTQPVCLFCSEETMRERLTSGNWYLTMGDTDWM
jgi:GNAT superfamily N-acetyltransferase